MRELRAPEDASLLDILIDGFEKNESMGGFHWRTLPLRDEAGAMAKLEALAAEAIRWKGPPLRDERTGPRRVVAWPDLELRQIGRGLMVRARTTGFGSWWHERETWENDPMGPIHEWVDEDRSHP